MADSADSPRASSSEFAPATPAGTPPGRDPMRGFASAPPADSAELYQPLALSAIVGFAMALFYALFIVGSAVFTYFSSDILFMPVWTLLLPAVVLLVCWIGRWSVLNSEGTRGGAKLANWGLVLAIIPALAYWAYHMATIVAVRQQAAGFVNSKFIDALKKGNIEEAFLLTTPPPRPLKNLRHFIE